MYVTIQFVTIHGSNWHVRDNTVWAMAQTKVASFQGGWTWCTCEDKEFNLHSSFCWISRFCMECISCMGEFRALHSCMTGMRSNLSCRPLPSNQSFYRQIAGYQRGAGDYRVGQWWEGSWAYKLVLPCISCTPIKALQLLYYAFLNQWSIIKTIERRSIPVCILFWPAIPTSLFNFILVTIVLLGNTI
jgi:hypothetical protein